jgi:hypothetical protein
MKQQRKHWENKRLTKGQKHFFWDEEIEKERPNKNKYF